MEIKISFENEEERSELLQPVIDGIKRTEKNEVTFDEAEKLINEVLVNEFVKLSAKVHVTGVRSKIRTKKVEVGIVPQDVVEEQK